MEKLLSFHGDQKIKDQLVANLAAHKKADEIVQGTYWSGGKGCAVGCSIIDFGGDPESHSEYERLFGIARSIARIEDGIFEGLSVEDSKWWPGAFAEAVPVGKDLSMVVPKFLVFILEEVLQYASSDGKKSIQAVIDLYVRKIAGEIISVDEWKKARADAGAYNAAAAAADAYADAYAADAYAAAAYAAAAYDAAAYAYAAYAAAAAAAADADAYTAARRVSRKKQALKLIEILTSCNLTN